VLILSGCTGTALAQHTSTVRPPLEQAPSAEVTPSPTATQRAAAAVGSGLVTARQQAIVTAYLAQMTLDEKIGQLMLLETYYTGDSELINSVGPLHLGAVVIYNMNFQGLDALHAYIDTLQAHAPIPLLVSADEEGGSVDRLQLSGMPLRPSAQEMAASQNPQVAYTWGATDAHDLLAAGINTDLAPVVDVRTTGDAFEGSRLWGNDPATVDQLAGSFLAGLQQNGVAGCLKHWPGMGSLTLDPHLTLPITYRTRSQLESTDFATFRSLLALHPAMIMTTHLLVQEIDPTLPADLSPLVVQSILRDELHYDGVIMTDSLHMAGIATRYSLGEAAVLAILAGNDLIEGAWDAATLSDMESSVRAAVTSGRISMARIDQSVQRILLLKARYGMLAAPLTSVTSATVNAPPSPIGDAELPRHAHA
jgi:beta-N-acetylhexosaminidase